MRKLLPVELKLFSCCGVAIAVLFGASASGEVGPNGEIEGLTAKFIDVNGMRTRYYDYGDGEPVVLLHGGIGVGGSSTANNWSRNIPGLADDYRVLVPDRPGQGLTEAPADPADFGTEGGIEHTYRFIRELGLEQVHLVGHSSGGAMAFYTALDHPEVVRTLTIVSVGPGMPLPRGGSKLDSILEETCPPPPGVEYSFCRQQALGYTPETFPPEFAEAEAWMAAQPVAQEARRRAAEARAAALAAGEEPNIRFMSSRDLMLLEHSWERARNGEAQMPILIVAAKQDPLSWAVDEEHAMMTPELNFFDMIGTRNDRIKMVLLNEGAHFPYRDQPEKFNYELKSFIEFWSAN